MVRKNKKGLSVMIGYILLVSFALVMAVIVYSYLKTYVPKQVTSCPDETSLFIKNFSCSNGELNITLKNNGRFSVAGYFIHGSNESTKDIATENMVTLLTPGGSNQNAYQAAVVFSISVNNTLKPGEEVENSYTLNKYVSYIEIIPVRFQEDNSKSKLISCGGSVAKEFVLCSAA